MRSISLLMALMCALVVVMVPQVYAKRYIVGGKMGWTSNVNYTIWAQDKHFYLDDWLCKSLSLSLSSEFSSDLLATCVIKSLV